MNTKKEAFRQRKRCLLSCAAHLSKYNSTGTKKVLKGLTKHYLTGYTCFSPFWQLPQKRRGITGQMGGTKPDPI